jgi:uncharacterized membrane protein YeaQ/YmgE (transglycosylase-associated protein family)
MVHPPTIPYLSFNQAEGIMAFLCWAVLGFSAGAVGSRLVSRSETRKKQSLLPDAPLGLAGAVAGGWLFYAFGPPGVNGTHLLSLLAAMFGSLVFLLAYYAVIRIHP